MVSLINYSLNLFLLLNLRKFFMQIAPYPSILGSSEIMIILRIGFTKSVNVCFTY